MEVGSVRSQVIAARTYSRPKDGGGFETWGEVVDRVIRHQRWLWQRALGDVPLNEKQEAELAELRQLMLDKKVSVSGRTLWLGGTDVAKTREASQFNCAFTVIESVHDVVDAFWLLLQGCGVGFEPVVGTLNGFTRQAEVRVERSQRHMLEQKKGREKNAEAWETLEDGRKVWRLTVGDSAEAWAKSVGKLLAQKKAFDVVVLDFSQIRPAGERLKGYGWISSGDETFAPAMEKIAQILNRRAGQLLQKMDILDILNHLGTTLSSRRSAEIALMPAADVEAPVFMVAKKDFWLHGNEHRQQSNNSLVFDEKPAKHVIAELFAAMQEAGGSEPGIINRQHGRQRAPWMRGVNPCVPGDTRILTREGYREIEDLVGKEVDVWVGDQFSTVKPYSTGVNPLVRVSLSDGTSLLCTPYHKWVLAGGVKVMAEELRQGDRLEKFEMPVLDGSLSETPNSHGYSQGFYSGDGNTGYDFSFIYEPKRAVIPRLKGTFSTPDSALGRVRWKHGPMLQKNFVPLNATKEYCLDWLAGLLDADGTVTRDINGRGIQLTSVDKHFLMEVRLMLTRLGVRAKVVAGASAGYRLMPNGRGGADVYDCQATHRLLIGNTDTWHLLQLGLKTERLVFDGVEPQRDARRFVTVDRVEFTGEYVETFCFTDRVNGLGTFEGIVTGQCAEILLPNKGFCNLVEVDLTKFNGAYHQLLLAIELIARANYRQTCVNLDDGLLQRAWHENNEFLRLCGVGMTGIVGWEFADHPDKIEDIRVVAEQSAKVMAAELGLPLPKAVTTIKPSGTLSKIMDTTEGIHRPLGRYIFNNVRFSLHDPLVEKLAKAGYRVMRDPSSKDAALVTFPVEYKTVEFDEVEGKAVNNESAIAQLERYKLWMKHYVQHNCSITVNYSPEEVPEIVDWMYDNWDSFVGVSFIYRTDPSKTAADLGYLYLPQEVVGETTFREYERTLKKVRGLFSGAEELSKEAEDLEVSAGGECSTGACPIR